MLIRFESCTIATPRVSIPYVLDIDIYNNVKTFTVQFYALAVERQESDRVRYRNEGTLTGMDKSETERKQEGIGHRASTRRSFRC